MLCWAHLVLPCSAEASYTMLFLALSWYFYASLTSCSRTRAVCMSPLLTFWWYAHTHTHRELEEHTHTHTQITRQCLSFSCLTARSISYTHTQSQYIYLAQELTHSCFTCLIVLVGHGMRLSECVSVEEKTRERERGETLGSGNKWHLLPAGSPRGCFHEHAKFDLV